MKYFWLGDLAEAHPLVSKMTRPMAQFLFLELSCQGTSLSPLSLSPATSILAFFSSTIHHFVAFFVLHPKSSAQVACEELKYCRFCGHHFYQKQINRNRMCIILHQVATITILLCFWGIFITIKSIGYIVLR